MQMYQFLDYLERYLHERVQKIKVNERQILLPTTLLINNGRHNITVKLQVLDENPHWFDTLVFILFHYH